MESHYVRSPELMHADDTTLVVIDVQEKLLPHIFNREALVTNIGRLVDGAGVVKLPVLSTEQYSKGLGPTVSSLAKRLGTPLEKLTFSCVGIETFRSRLADLNRRKVLLCGMESHVCVQQTAFDLMAEGYQVFLAVDAIGSRKQLDHDVAIRRMESLGVTVCSTEGILFEWCEEAGKEVFKAIKQLVVGQ